jgi:DNA-binding MarR family transcriptional regulator
MISYLHAHPAAHPSEMASALRVTRPNIAANLRLLEEKEYLVRMVDQENRRQVYVNLTRKGEQYYELCLQQLEYLFAGWFSILGEEEVKHLFNILAKSSDPSVMSDALKNFSFGK